MTVKENSTVPPINWSGNIGINPKDVIEVMSKLIKEREDLDKETIEAFANFIAPYKKSCADKFRKEGLPKCVYCGSEIFKIINEKFSLVMTVVYSRVLDDLQLVFMWADPFDATKTPEFKDPYLPPYHWEGDRFLRPHTW